MASKGELQTILKEKFGINKNISDPLSREDCEKLLHKLEQDSVLVKLVQSYAKKNSSLQHNNAYYGRLRSQAERKLDSLKTEYEQLERSIQSIEMSKGELERKKKELEEEHLKLETEVENLSQNNQSLTVKVQDLTSQNTELIDVNSQLKQENKDLKNIVDQIRLRLAQDMNALLQYEDSELRKAMIRLFKWVMS
ncbi:hypothetical protein [Thermoleptolyngbya sp.]